MMSNATGDLETPARQTDRTELFHVLERADRAYHDVLQTHIHEFDGRDLVPCTDGGRDVDDSAGADNVHVNTVAAQLRLAEDDDLAAAGLDREAHAESDDQEDA